ncbi:SLAP domain-containing protein [Shouchella sp. JSM 1781072]|uniref:SLAP domain-containing protein n=1 Tax=Shouchella sp. JSM 1781072 TaxID=3344581 RepID=UPI0035C242A5
MVQTLMLHPAWEKTIDPNDLSQIQQLLQQEPDQRFIPYRQAFNHRDDLLVTVIVQNRSEHPEEWEGRPLAYVEKGQTIAEKNFSIHTLPPFTSMPWTFIFEKGLLNGQSELRGLLIENI